MKQMKNVKRSEGFTIIELVVVILLLGILTATALPRFMDVTTQARTAVVNATAGGLTTGAALFRAQWFAEGATSGATVTQFGSMVANSAGYPAISNTCDTIYSNLLQSGAATVSGATTSGSTGCSFPLYDANGSSIGTVGFETTTGVAN